MQQFKFRSRPIGTRRSFLRKTTLSEKVRKLPRPLIQWAKPHHLIAITEIYGQSTIYSIHIVNTFFGVFCNMFRYYVFISFFLTISDNFSFQNNGIKTCTCWKTMVFLGKQWVFWKTMVFFLKAMFLTRPHAWFVLIIKHIHFIKIKTIHVLHKLSFYNTIPHISHSLIGHVIQELL